jgi:hypothetical protein
MGKPMYVTLDALTFTDTQDGQTKLIRHVDEEYKGKTFGDLIQRMVNGNVDEFNDQPYTPNENRLAQFVNGLLTHANSRPGDIQIYALSNQESSEEILVQLNQKVSEFNDRIIKYKTVPGPSGEENKIQQIELTIAGNKSGGLYRVETLDKMLMRYEI